MAELHTLENILSGLMDLVATAAKKRFRLQGHELTGKLIRTMEIRTRTEGTKVVGEILVEFYGAFVDQGVKAARIPYNPGRRTGNRVSKYIEGLKEYFKKRRGLDDREATSAAFATARVHKREGMPTRNSSRYSQDGNRTGFLARSAEETEQQVIDAFLKQSADALQIRINQVFADSERIFTIL